MSWPTRAQRADVDRPLLLTILSVLAGWSLLGVVAAGLLAILKPLEGVRRSLEKIAMGVRAIEQETVPLGAHAEALVGSLTGVGDGLEAATRRLADVGDRLDAADATLRDRLTS